MLFKPLVLDFLSENIWSFIAYILIILAFFPVKSVILPNIYGMMFDQIKTISKFTDIYNFRENFAKMNFPGALIALIVSWIVVILSSSVKTYIESLLIPGYFTYLRQLLFAKTVNSYQAEYRDVKTGEYLTRALELTRHIRDLFQYLLSQFLPELIVSLMIVGYMFVQHATLGWILLAGCIICAIIQYFGNAELFKLIIDRETFFNTTVSENLRDSLDNLMNVFLNNTVDHEIEKNASLENKSREKFQRIMYFQGMISFMTDFTIVATFAVSLLFLYYLISKKDVKVTQGIVMVMILGQFLNNFVYVNNGFIYNIAYRIGLISSSREYLENIFGSKGDRTLSSGITNGNIEYKNVKFRYDKTQDNYIYDDLNIQFESGKRYAIVGQSGAGKTTMMKLLVGLYTPESGAIYIDSVDTRHLKLDYLRKNVNYINQRTTLFNETVMYNMLYGNPDVSEKTVIAKLKKYDLLKIFDEIPDGVYANAGVNGGNLSGGMQRIVILMRGILKPGVIVIMDEPTTGLDTNTIHNVKNMIFDETVGKTLIVVTHELLMRSGMEVKEL
jgi:ABC-type multidrug transport system fused ATPase/permease subunit